jgi:hypothetical protein
MKRNPVKKRDYVKKYMDLTKKPQVHKDKTQYDRKEKYKSYIEPDDDIYDEYEDIYEHGSKEEMRKFMNHIHHPKE